MEHSPGISCLLNYEMMMPTNYHNARIWENIMRLWTDKNNRKRTSCYILWIMGKQSYTKFVYKRSYYPSNKILRNQTQWGNHTYMYQFFWFMREPQNVCNSKQITSVYVRNSQTKIDVLLVPIMNLTFNCKHRRDEASLRMNRQFRQLDIHPPYTGYC